MKNRKGFLLAEETLKIILAVIALVILAYLLFSLYSANKDTQNLELARESLDFLSQEINSQAESVDIYNPKGWVFSSWPSGNLPLSCSNLGWNNCICLCKDSLLKFNKKNECDSAGACLENIKEFSLDDSIKISNPPITLNLDYENKRIS